MQNKLSPQIELRIPTQIQQNFSSESYLDEIFLQNINLRFDASLKIQLI